MDIKEILIIIIASIILGFTIAFPNFSAILSSIIYMLIILAVNIVIKKTISYYLEADVTTKFWGIYQYGFKKGSHFSKSLPMFWLAPLLSIITGGYFFWLAILEFDISPRTERVSKRHGLYRFSEMTEWHIASIACWGIAANLILATIAYFLATWIPGMETFAKLNIYFAAWSLIPLSSLDGGKILFGSRVLWIIFAAITFLFLIFAFSIVA
jgi:membrane-associated protease RseP (regulator of RpoE activity)